MTRRELIRKLQDGDLDQEILISREITNEDASWPAPPAGAEQQFKIVRVEDELISVEITGTYF